MITKANIYPQYVEAIRNLDLALTNLVDNYAMFGTEKDFGELQESVEAYYRELAHTPKEK